MGKRNISYPLDNNSGLLSYFVFNNDEVPSQFHGSGTLDKTPGGRPLKYMRGVLFADKAKAEINRLRCMVLELEKENEALRELACDIKFKYYKRDIDEFKRGIVKNDWIHRLLDR